MDTKNPKTHVEADSSPAYSKRRIAAETPEHSKRKGRSMKRTNSKGITNKKGFTMTKDQSPEDKPRGKRLEFTCRWCGGHRVEEIVLMRREIVAVYDQGELEYEDNYSLPDYPGACDDFMTERNYYRCCTCKGYVNDHGRIEWGREFLVKYVTAYAAPHGDDPTSPDQGTT